MLGRDRNPVLAPTHGVLMPEQQPPPMPQGALNAEAVPAAQKDQPLPLIRVLIPVVMVVAIAAVMGLMVASGRQMSPMMLVFPLMMLIGMVAMFNPTEGKGDIDETRRVYLRHLDALVGRARTNAVKQREPVSYTHLTLPTSDLV